MKTAVLWLCILPCGTIFMDTSQTKTETTSSHNTTTATTNFSTQATSNQPRVASDTRIAVLGVAGGATLIMLTLFGVVLYSCKGVLCASQRRPTIQSGDQKDCQNSVMELSDLPEFSVPSVQKISKTTTTETSLLSPSEKSLVRGVASTSQQLTAKPPKLKSGIVLGSGLTQSVANRAAQSPQETAPSTSETSRAGTPEIKPAKTAEKAVAGIAEKKDQEDGSKKLHIRADNLQVEAETYTSLPKVLSKQFLFRGKESVDTPGQLSSSDRLFTKPF